MPTKVPKSLSSRTTEADIKEWRRRHERSVNPHVFCDPECPTCKLLFPNGGPKAAYRQRAFEKYRKCLEIVKLKPSNSKSYEFEINKLQALLKKRNLQINDLAKENASLQQEVAKLRENVGNVRKEVEQAKEGLTNERKKAMHRRHQAFVYFLDDFWNNAVFSERFTIAHFLKSAIAKSKIPAVQFFEALQIDRTYYYHVLANERHDLTDKVKRSYAVCRKTDDSAFIAAVAELHDFIKEFCDLKLSKGEKKDDEPQLMLELQLPTKRDMWLIYRKWATYKALRPDVEPFKKPLKPIERLLHNTHPERMPEGVSGFVSYTSFYYHFPKDVRLAEAEYFSCKICSEGWFWINQKIQLKLEHNRQRHPEKNVQDLCDDDAQCWKSDYDASPHKASIEAGIKTYNAHKKTVSDQRLTFNDKRDSLKRRNSDYDAVIAIDFSPYCQAYQRQNSMADMMNAKQALHVVIYTRTDSPLYENYKYAHQVYFSRDTNDCYFTIVALMYLFAHESSLKDKSRVLITSDGCHKHFKSCHVLAIVAVMLKKKFCFDVLHWNFFGSYHGKSGCDANAAHVKFTLKKFALTSSEPIRSIDEFVKIVNEYCPTTNAHGLHWIAHKDPRLKMIHQPPADLSQYHHFRWDGETNDFGGFRLVCSKTAVTAALGDTKSFIVYFLFPDIVHAIIDTDPQQWVVSTKLQAETKWRKLGENVKEGADKARKLLSAQMKYLKKDVKVAHVNEKGRMKNGKLLQDWHHGRVEEVEWCDFNKDKDPNYTPSNRKGEPLDEGILLTVRYYEDKEEQDEQSKKKLKKTKNSPKNQPKMPKNSTKNPKKILGFKEYYVPLDGNVKLYKASKTVMDSTNNK